MKQDGESLERDGSNCQLSRTVIIVLLGVVVVVGARRRRSKKDISLAAVGGNQTKHSQ